MTQTDTSIRRLAEDVLTFWRSLASESTRGPFAMAIASSGLVRKHSVMGPSASTGRCFARTESPTSGLRGQLRLD